MNNHDNTAGAEASAAFPASGNALPMEPGFYNMDCMEALRRFPDSFFDLAIVDPPYGGGYVAQDHATGLHGGGSSWAGNERGRWSQRFDRYHIGPAAVSGGGGAPGQPRKSADGCNPDSCADQSHQDRRDLGGEVQPAGGRLRCSFHKALGHCTIRRILRRAGARQQTTNHMGWELFRPAAHALLYRMG